MHIAFSSGPYFANQLTPLANPRHSFPRLHRARNKQGSDARLVVAAGIFGGLFGGNKGSPKARRFGLNFEDKSRPILCCVT